MKDDELREIIAGHGGSLDGTADRPKLQQRAQDVVESLSRRLNDARQCTRYVQDIEVAQQNAVALRELLRDRPTRATAVGALLADPNAVPQLVNVARAPTASLATRAVLFECLGEFGDASAESPVHRDGLAVDAALRALGMRSPPDQYADQQSQDAMHAAATKLLRACAPAIGGTDGRGAAEVLSRRVEYAVNIAQPDLDAATALGLLARRSPAARFSCSVATRSATCDA